MSVIIATAASAINSSIEEIQSKVRELEEEIATLKAENARLKKYESQVIALKYGDIRKSTEIPGGFMGYGTSEWSSNASSGC